MRFKSEAVFEFGVDDDQQPKNIIREYRDQYKVIQDKGSLFQIAVRR